MKTIHYCLLTVALILSLTGMAEASDIASVILNANGTVAERLNAVHCLGRNLPESEIKTLCQFIRALPDPREKNLPACQLLKNDLLNALMEQSVPPAALAPTLIATYADPRQDLVTRDYILQHLVTWYEQGAGDSSTDRKKIRAVLQSAAQEQNRLAGTALLGLHRLSAIDPAFDRAAIKKMAVAMAEHAPALDSRITAVQVCAEDGAVEILPLIRSLSQNERSLPLRISAIAALGQLGGHEDIIALQKLAGDPEPALRPAIAAALRRLQHEFQPSTVALNLN